MAKEVDEIVVGANGTVWVGDKGSAVPVSPTASPGSGWSDLGYVSEDGATVTDTKDLEAISVWQLFYAARRIITGRDFMVAFVLRQWSAETVRLAFGGGTVEETGVSSGIFRYSPPEPEIIDERMLMLDWTDNDKHYRLILRRGMVTENVETQIQRSAAADLPITFSIIGEDGVVPWELLTDDESFAG